MSFKTLLKSKIVTALPFLVVLSLYIDSTLYPRGGNNVSAVQSLPSAVEFGRTAEEIRLEKVCSTLRKYPKPCIYDPKNKNCTYIDGMPVMFSHGQLDYFLFTKHFQHKRSTGVYVDVASNDPVDRSSTFFFDRCLGWKGICVEANSDYHPATYSVRSCAIVPTCVADRSGKTVVFNMAGGHGGILNERYKFNDKATKSTRSVMRKLPLNCTTGKEICERHNVRHIDYLSIDIEGGELDFLHGFDFKSTSVNIITVEIGSLSKNITAFLKEKSFRPMHFRYITSFNPNQAKYMNFDTVYIHSSVVFGKPI